MTICIIGIDSATEAKKTGLARGILTGDELTIDRLEKPGAQESVSDIVANWINREIPTLITVDAPLGWPMLLGKFLSIHSAGNVIDEDANRLFRRETDRFINRTIKKHPLDVGADRIARTALSALGYLNEIKSKTGLNLSLAWDSHLLSGLYAIEVYPAATLKQSGSISQGYKKKANISQRKQILESLSDDMTITADQTLMIQDDDILDAAICVLAGYHFMKDRCFKPENMLLAQKEGWIWVRE